MTRFFFKNACVVAHAPVGVEGDFGISDNNNRDFLRKSTLLRNAITFSCKLLKILRRLKGMKNRSLKPSRFYASKNRLFAVTKLFPFNFLLLLTCKSHDYNTHWSKSWIVKQCDFNHRWLSQRTEIIFARLSELNIDLNEPHNFRRERACAKLKINDRQVITLKRRIVDVENNEITISNKDESRKCSAKFFSAQPPPRAALGLIILTL